jgi:hypothetical protein
LPDRRRRGPAAIAALASVAALAAADRAAAQGAIAAQCAAVDRVVQDSCQKSVDLFDFVAPQLGTTVAGGNAIVGDGGAFGRAGRFAVGLRLNAARGRVPDARGVTLGTSGPQRSDFGVDDGYLAVPVLDAAVGLFGGFRAAGATLGAVDALASATFVPDYDGAGLAVETPDGSIRAGYGVRVGLLQERRGLPGVAVTYLRRDLPSVDVRAAAAGRGTTRDDTVGVRGLDVATQGWRAVIGKRLALLRIAAGVGRDRYESKATLGAVVNESVAGSGVARFETPPVGLAQRLTRNTAFVDALLDLRGVKLAAELGRATGGTVRQSYNTFGGGAARVAGPSTYFAAVLRVGH